MARWFVTRTIWKGAARNWDELSVCHRPASTFRTTAEQPVGSWLHVAAKVEPRFTSSAGRAVSVLKTRLHSEREQHRVSNGPGHDALYYESLLRRWIFLQPLVWGVVGDVWVLRVRTRRSADTTEPLVSLRCENTQRRFKCRLFYIIKNKTTYCGSLGWISRAEWLRGNQ